MVPTPGQRRTDALVQRISDQVPLAPFDERAVFVVLPHPQDLAADRWQISFLLPGAAWQLTLSVDEANPLAQLYDATPASSVLPDEALSTLQQINDVLDGMLVAGLRHRDGPTERALAARLQGAERHPQE